MHTVYIIYSPSIDQYYIGQARDMKIAIWQHNAKANRVTAEGKPWEVRYTKSFETRNEALSLEMRLKAKKREQLEEIINAN